MKCPFCDKTIIAGCFSARLEKLFCNETCIINWYDKATGDGLIEVAKKIEQGKLEF